MAAFRSADVRHALRRPPRPTSIRCSATPLPAVGSTIETTCLRVAYGGSGVAKTDAGVTVLLSPGACVPGDVLRATVTRARRRHVEARVVAVLSPGPAAAATPPWPERFAACGGLRLQRLAYAEQLRTKRQWAIDALARAPGGAAAVLAGRGAGGGEGGAPAAAAAAALEAIVGPTVPSARRTRYRNKATFFFAAREDGGGGLAVGSKAEEDAGRVVPLGGGGCPLQAEEADDVLASLAAWAAGTGLRAFDEKSPGDPGGLWQAVLRTSPGEKVGRVPRICSFVPPCLPRL